MRRDCAGSTRGGAVPGKPRRPLRPEPVLARAATLLLGAMAEGVQVFEFGSGGSTLYLAQRAAWLVSVEHDADWAAAVRAGLERYELGAEVRQVEINGMANAISGEGLWDLVFVDCIDSQRKRAIANGARHVKPGGWLVADDYDTKPNVRRAVERLRGAGWDVGLVAGVKVHALRGRPVRTMTAFCWRGDACS